MEKALIISNQLGTSTSVGRATDAIIHALTTRGVAVITAFSADDGKATIIADTSLDAILIDWDMEGSREAIKAIRLRNTAVPVFLLLDRSSLSSVPTEIMEIVTEIVWMLEDTTPFIAGRVEAAMKRYTQTINPPLFRDLIRFNEMHEYSWHTPGHTGGIAFLKTTVGRAFYEYFGENLFRSDLSISVGELGSLLDHSGSIGESEKYIARVFGADRSYTVTNGSSTSNRMIYMASLTTDDLALCDRNCHKSVEQAIAITGALPTYVLPLRNYLGIIGPIPPERLTPHAIQESIAKNPLTKHKKNKKTLHATITNSTYDGICYHARDIIEVLTPSVDRIHFDEAWYGYARFNKLYTNRYGMYGSASDYPDDAPTIFTTQSSHKLLAALSQASYIHVRDGRNAIDHDRFNQSFMMNSSTSPLYPIIASNEISAAMMDEAGPLLTTESIREAVDFRQMVMKYHRELSQDNGWFFTTWNPDEVTDPRTGEHVPFASADPELLTTDPNCWILHPNESWHGYGELADGYAMLDPIKVSVVTPGMNRDGTMAETGIPAMVLVSYLDARGIINEKTTDFTVLFLFSMGITKGKWGTLLNALLSFKKDYDANTSLKIVLPNLVASYPEKYGSLGLRDLCDQMFRQMKSTQQTQIQDLAFETLPHPDMTPHKAYQQIVKNNIEQLPLYAIAGRTMATGIVPYPPGIPLLMPGENTGSADGPIIGYLRALQKFDKKFPGFTHDSHGVEIKDGVYYIDCIKK